LHSENLAERKSRSPLFRSVGIVAWLDRDGGPVSIYLARMRYAFIYFSKTNVALSLSHARNPWTMSLLVCYYLCEALSVKTAGLGGGAKAGFGLVSVTVRRMRRRLQRLATPGAGPLLGL
jgi:hypothetical protein